MENFKTIAIQALIILTVSALIAVLFIPLANTDWAEGIRTSSDGEREQEGFREEGRARADMPAVLGWIMSLVKIVMLMGIPGLITLGIRRLVKGKPKSKSAAPA